MFCGMHEQASHILVQSYKKNGHTRPFTTNKYTKRMQNDENLSFAMPQNLQIYQKRRNFADKQKFTPRTPMYIYKRLFLLIGVVCCGILGATAQHLPQVHRHDALRHSAHVVRPMAQPQRAPYDVTLLSENFNKFTAGTEANPDQHDLCEEKRDWCIDPALLQTPGWNGGGIYQAGGCAYIYAYFNDFDSQYYLGYLESPRFDTSESRGEFVVCFRARSVLEQDWLGVCGVPTNHSEAKQKFAVIGQEWGYYEVTLQCGDENTCVQFEPLSEGCYIDDVRIIQVLDDEPDLPSYALDTPEILPVDDFTADGYTARWNAVRNADDYALYDYLYYTAAQDGAPFDYINTDFSAITAGSIEAPVEPGGESDFYTYLDEWIDRADWMAYMPMFAGGSLALDNSYSSMMPAGLSSPTLRIAEKGEDLHISIDVMSPELTTMTLYVYGEKGPLGEEEIALSPKWTTHEITLHECPSEVSFELVVEDMEPGFVYVDNLRIWQNLHKGTTARTATNYFETAGTKQYVATPNTPSGYRHAFSVSAYKYEIDEEGDIVDYVMSAWSEPCFADGQPADGIIRTHCTTQPHRSFNLSGRAASSADRIVIEDGRKMKK